MNGGRKIDKKERQGGGDKTENKKPNTNNSERVKKSINIKSDNSEKK